MVSVQLEKSSDLQITGDQTERTSDRQMVMKIQVGEVVKQKETSGVSEGFYVIEYKNGVQ